MTSAGDGLRTVRRLMILRDFLGIGASFGAATDGCDRAGSGLSRAVSSALAWSCSLRECVCRGNLIICNLLHDALDRPNHVIAPASGLPSRLVPRSVHLSRLLRFFSNFFDTINT